MKIKIEAATEGGIMPSHLKTVHIRLIEPFCVSRNGVLLHRVRTARRHYMHGKYRHTSVSLWCGNGFNGPEMIERPDDSRLLCERCEKIATEAGELKASTLAGKHVHTGRMVPKRTCCTNDRN